MTGTALLFWLLVAAIVVGVVWAMTGRGGRVPRGVHNTPHNTPEPAVTPGPEHAGPGRLVERGAGADQSAADRALHEFSSELAMAARAAGVSRVPPPTGGTDPGHVTVPTNISLPGGDRGRPNRTGDGKPFGGGDLGRGSELSARHNLEPAVSSEGVRSQVGGRTDPNLWGEPRGFGGHQATASGQTPDGIPGTDGRPEATPGHAGPTSAASAASDEPGSALGGGATEVTDAGRTGQGTTKDRLTAGELLAPAPDRPRVDRP